MTLHGQGYSHHSHVITLLTNLVTGAPARQDTLTQCQNIRKQLYTLQFINHLPTIGKVFTITEKALLLVYGTGAPYDNCKGPSRDLVSDFENFNVGAFAALVYSQSKHRR